jgi:malate dehydrogenase
VCSDGSYGIDEGLIFGFPLKSDGQHWKLVEGIEHNDFARQKIQATLEELRAERDTIRDLLKG